MEVPMALATRTTDELRALYAQLQGQPIPPAAPSTPVPEKHDDQ